MYDLVIIGSGASGYTAGLYASRYKMKTLIIGNQEGGQSALAHDIENYPGFLSIKGPELMKKFKESALEYGAELQMDEVKEIIKNDDNYFSVNLAYSGKSIKTKTVLLAVGTKNRKLNVKGEDAFYGKGVTYCATCDGFFFKDKVVGIVGGGDSAATSALYMSSIAEKVYLFVRGDKMIAEPTWQDKIKENSGIEVLYNTSILEFLGDDKLNSVKTNKKDIVNLDGCFIEIGANPNTVLLDKFNIAKDEFGYIVVNKDQSIPSVKGLFASGDVTTNSNHFHQIATSIGEGSVAANGAFNYVSKN
jgi:thioredoxin reductase (NADPH)